MTPGVGDTLTLRVDDIAFGGEGVGRFSELVVFVPFVCIGERVEVEITGIHKRFARGRLLRVLEGAPERVPAPCPYFGDCGGCQYQHMAYEAQLRAKHKQVQDLFQRIGGIGPEVVRPIIPCPNPYGYRNRVMIRSQWDKFKQGLNIGFIRYDNRLVVDIEDCKIAEPGVNEQIRQVRAHPPPKGGIKVVLRIAPPGWEVPRDSFFQNNFFLLPALVEVVRGYLRTASGNDGFHPGGACARPQTPQPCPGGLHLLDLYCGVGFFSLELARDVAAFTGVELDRLAIEAARKNATARGITNGRFIAGNTEEVLPRVLARHSAESTSVLLDPPRKGCHPSTLELLRKHRPRQLVYVSCHPATMARDLNILSTGGVFKVAAVTPLDMFPQTAHVECVADLRSDAGSGLGPGERT